MGIFFEALGHFRFGEIDGVHRCASYLFRDGEEREILCEFIYRARADSWDVRFVGFEWGGHDIWEQLTEKECVRVNLQINRVTSELRRRIGVTSRRSSPYR